MFRKILSWKDPNFCGMFSPYEIAFIAMLSNFLDKDHQSNSSFPIEIMGKD